MLYKLKYELDLIKKDSITLVMYSVLIFKLQLKFYTQFLTTDNKANDQWRKLSFICNIWLFVRGWSTTLL